MNATCNTALDKAVNRIIKRHAKGYDKGIPDFMADLYQGGCESGLVGELVYYKDTLAFYRRHKAEINTLLYELIDEVGGHCPVDLFGDKWDSNDPLALDSLNQNLLAWFAFEETARRLYPDD